MKWITRERPKIDRIASPWLIKTFVDKEAEFIYVPFSEVLDKALAAGQISVLEYFVELNYYNTTFNSYLEIEKEYHEVVASLFKYKL